MHCHVEESIKQGQRGKIKAEGKKLLNKLSSDYMRGRKRPEEGSAAADGR